MNNDDKKKVENSQNLDNNKHVKNIESKDLKKKESDESFNNDAKIGKESRNLSRSNQSTNKSNPNNNKNIGKENVDKEDIVKETKQSKNITANSVGTNETKQKNAKSNSESDSKDFQDKTKKESDAKTQVGLTKNNKKRDKSSVVNKSNRSNEENNEFIEKLVSINRVAKVVKGGRRFSFAALVVVGDGNGKVGHGKGKAKEVPEAIKKATDEAKLNMLRIPLRQGRTLHHDISGRFDSGRVFLRSAPSGTGVIAGGPMRAVFEALGIQDIVAKSVGSSNPHNMVRATFNALESVSSPKLIALRRGLKINDITKRRKTNNLNLDGGQDV